MNVRFVKRLFLSRYASAVLTCLLVAFPAYPQTLPNQTKYTSPPAPDVFNQTLPIKELTVKEREDFRLHMSRTPLPSTGCFEAHYPDVKWKSVQCGQAPVSPNPVARGAKPNLVGAGTDNFTQVTGNISSATGSFDNVTGATSEFGSILGGPVLHPNIYSLQINSNTFTTTACAGSPGCTGWEQFLFSQSQCTIGGNRVPCIFIQYWLLNHTSPCPTNSWIYYPGSKTTLPGCYLDTAFTSVPNQMLSQLGALVLTGSVSGGLDTVMLSTANGTVYARNNNSIANLGMGWTGAEFNIFGDCCDSEAYFTDNTSVTIRLNTINGFSTAPTCSSSNFSGPTAEKNNLFLTGTCSSVAGSSPAIVFTETGGGPLPPGTSIGDPHITTFYGVHYDLMQAGEFLLVEADPNFSVQTRLALVTPNVAVNTGVATKMGKSHIAICPNGLEVDGKGTSLDDGKSLSLANGVEIARRGNVYTVSRPGGDVVQVNNFVTHMDVSVSLGATNRRSVRGLLGGASESKELIDVNGKAVPEAPSQAEFREFADSWLVPSSTSFLCSTGKVKPEYPKRPFYAADLSKAEQSRARGICVNAGVSENPLLEDCILDVSVLGSDSAADAFVHARMPEKVIRISPSP